MKFNKKVLAATALTAAVALPLVALAQVNSNVINLGEAQQLGLGTADLKTTIINIIKSILGLLGLIAVVVILIGGFKWMTAAGNEDKVADAKKILVSGIIGLVIILLAYSIAQFVLTALTNVSSGGTF